MVIGRIPSSVTEMVREATNGRINPEGFDMEIMAREVRYSKIPHMDRKKEVRMSD